ncbi:hypothetical protein NDU88_004287 [Pleurodeles waltl]|uniref:Uncharacterized protein n=1 Tax=Pleurodeles waltl TaxID=8319 RepID=A0AAV7W6X5_PLEWA|nr:hypothetical protein NDU88_004287 [Pleurodeles waltl]
MGQVEGVHKKARRTVDIVIRQLLTPGEFQASALGGGCSVAVRRHQERPGCALVKGLVWSARVYIRLILGDGLAHTVSTNFCFLFGRCPQGVRDNYGERRQPGDDTPGVRRSELTVGDQRRPQAEAAEQEAHEPCRHPRSRAGVRRQQSFLPRTPQPGSSRYRDRGGVMRAPEGPLSSSLSGLGVPLTRVCPSPEAPLLPGMPPRTVEALAGESAGRVVREPLPLRLPLELAEERQLHAAPLTPESSASERAQRLPAALSGSAPSASNGALGCRCSVCLSVLTQSSCFC